MGDRGAALDRSPDGALPLRVLRTWAAPNMDYAQPLKRLDLNFTPFVTQPFTWVLPGVLTAFCPKRKIAPHNLARGDFYLPPSTASDSRHDLSPSTTLSRGAAGRVCLWALAHRGAAGRGCQRVLTRF